MGDNGRLIINARGETAQVLQATQQMPATLQIMVRADRANTIQAGIVSELELTPREMIALAAKLADAAGYAAEFRRGKPRLAGAQRSCYARSNALCRRQSECGWNNECVIERERNDQRVTKIVPAKPATQENNTITYNHGPGMMRPAKQGEGK